MLPENEKKPTGLVRENPMGTSQRNRANSYQNSMVYVTFLLSSKNTTPGCFCKG